MSCSHNFEEEGILLLERGDPLPSEMASCADCQAEAAQYQRLVEALEQLEADAPAADWKDRVWAQVDTAAAHEMATDGKASPEPPKVADFSRRRSRARKWFLLPALPLAAGLLAVFFMRSQDGGVPASVPDTEIASVDPSDPPEPSIKIVVIGSTDVTLRGEAATLGRLLVEADDGGMPFAELRVYRNDTVLVARCWSEEPCRRTGNTSAALDLQLESLGDYQAILLVSSNSLPEPRADLDLDAGAVLDGGGRAVLADLVSVQ